MPAGRPPSVPHRTLPQTIQALRQALSKRPADVPIWLGRVALGWLERLQEREAELFQLRDIAAQHEALLETWQPLRDAAEARGVEIYQQFGADVWMWRYRERSGTADTPGAALVAALLSE